MCTILAYYIYPTTNLQPNVHTYDYYVLHLQNVLMFFFAEQYYIQIEHYMTEIELSAIQVINRFLKEIMTKYKTILKSFWIEK